MSDSRAAVLERSPAVTDCWNKIGVRGDSSCGELKEHIHCRNCPVYSGAAVALLDAELPADYRSQGALRAGREKASVVLDTHSVVVFRVRSEWLALPTTVLREIVSVRPIHAVPHRRDGVLLGLANIRGELLACFSLSQVLGLGEAVELKPLKARATERFLVIEHDSSRAVCPVDEVCGVLRFHPRDLIPVPATVAKATSTYTRSLLPWQGKALGLLDEELLLHTVDRDMA
jgi:chemotaxis-related protein WspD